MHVIKNYVKTLLLSCTLLFATTISALAEDNLFEVTGDRPSIDGIGLLDEYSKYESLSCAPAMPSSPSGIRKRICISQSGYSLEVNYYSRNDQIIRLLVFDYDFEQLQQVEQRLSKLACQKLVSERLTSFRCQQFNVTSALQSYGNLTYNLELCATGYCKNIE